jgi:hypothetical protein
MTYKGPLSTLQSIFALSTGRSSDKPIIHRSQVTQPVPSAAVSELGA